MSPRWRGWAQDGQDEAFVAGRLCPCFGFWKDQLENHVDILAAELCTDVFVDMSEITPKMFRMRAKMAMTRANMVKMRRKRAKTRPKMAKIKLFGRGGCVHSLALEGHLGSNHSLTLYIGMYRYVCMHVHDEAKDTPNHRYLSTYTCRYTYIYTHTYIYTYVYIYIYL